MSILRKFILLVAVLFTLAYGVTVFADVMRGYRSATPVGRLPDGNPIYELNGNAYVVHCLPDGSACGVIYTIPISGTLQHVWLDGAAPTTTFYVRPASETLFHVYVDGAAPTTTIRVESPKGPDLPVVSAAGSEIIPVFITGGVVTLTVQTVAGAAAGVHYSELPASQTLWNVNHLPSVDTNIAEANAALHGPVTSQFPASLTDQWVDATSKALHVNGTAGQTQATHWTPNDGTCVFTSNVTLTCSGFPTTVDDANGTVISIMYYPTGSTFRRVLINGVGGVSMKAAANVITVAGAGTPFAALDTYRVGVQFQQKEHDATTNAGRVSETNPINQQMYSELLIDTTNQSGTAYYPSSSGWSNQGQPNFSITGYFIEATAAITTTFTVECTNDPDATDANAWRAMYGEDWGNNANVNSFSQTGAGTLQVHWVFPKANFRACRFKVVYGDATNTESFYLQHSPL